MNASSIHKVLVLTALSCWVAVVSSFSPSSSFLSLPQGRSNSKYNFQERSGARRTNKNMLIQSAVQNKETRTSPTRIGLARGNSDDSDRTAYDLIVIGAGPVGVSAACKAATPPYNKRVCLVDAPRASGVLMDESTNQDLSIGGPTGLFSKALRDTSKRIRVSSLKGMGLRDDRYVEDALL